MEKRSLLCSTCPASIWVWWFSHQETKNAKARNKKQTTKINWSKVQAREQDSIKVWKIKKQTEPHNTESHVLYCTGRKRGKWNTSVFPKGFLSFTIHSISFRCNMNYSTSTKTKQATASQLVFLLLYSLPFLVRNLSSLLVYHFQRIWKSGHSGVINAWWKYNSYKQKTSVMQWTTQVPKKAKKKVWRKLEYAVYVFGFRMNTF